MGFYALWGGFANKVIETTGASAIIGTGTTREVAENFINGEIFDWFGPTIKEAKEAMMVEKAALYRVARQVAEERDVPLVEAQEWVEGEFERITGTWDTDDDYEFYAFYVDEEELVDAIGDLLVKDEDTEE
jgi:hypothetical protein